MLCMRSGNFTDKISLGIFSSFLIMQLFVSDQPAFFSSCDKTNVSFIPPTLESRGVVQRTITGLYHPWGVAVSNIGEVVVSEHFCNCVSVYSRDGENIGSFGSHGFGKGQHPHGVAITSDNHILVADEANHRIQMWSPNGTFMGVIGQKGRHLHQFYFPSGIQSIPLVACLWLIQSSYPSTSC